MKPPPKAKLSGAEAKAQQAELTAKRRAAEQEVRRQKREAKALASKAKAEEEAKAAAETERMRDPRHLPVGGDLIDIPGGFLVQVCGRFKGKVAAISDPNGTPWRHEISLRRFRTACAHGTVIKKAGVSVAPKPARARK